MTTKRVIWLDENPTLLHFERSQLSGVEVVFANEFHQVMEELKTNNIDFFVTDLSAEGLSGSNAIQKVRETYPSIPAAIYTNVQPYPDIEEAILKLQPPVKVLSKGNEESLEQLIQEIMNAEYHSSEIQEVDSAPSRATSLSIQINGHTLATTFDTGADQSWASLEVLQEVGIREVGELSADHVTNTAHGQIEYMKLDVPAEIELANGETKFVNLKLNAVPNWDKNVFSSSQHSMILGANFLSENKIHMTLDYNEKLERRVQLSSEQMNSDDNMNTEKRRLSLIESIPSQHPFVRFSGNGRGALSLQTSSDEDDDVTTIDQIRKELILLLKQEIHRYTLSGNRPQAELLQPLYTAYLDEISKPISDIIFAILFIKGTRIISTKDSIAAELSDINTEWPAFLPDERAALDSISVFHGILMMASNSGQKLINDSIVFNLESGEAETIEDAFDQLTSQNENDDDLFDHDTRELIDELASLDSDESNRAKIVRMKVAMLSSLSVLMAGATFAVASTVGTSTLMTGAAITALPLWFGAIFAKKVVENDPDFKDVVDKSGEMVSITAEKIDAATRALIHRLDLHFKRNRARLATVAKRTKELAWISAISDFVKEKSGEEEK